MKKPFLLVLVFICIVKSTLSQPADSTTYKPVISAEALNVLYIGLKNPVSVSVPGYLPSQIRVEASAGNITGDSGNYVISFPYDIDKKFRDMVLYVYITDKDSVRKTAGSKRFLIRHLPRPVLFYGHVAGGDIRVEEALMTDFLRIECGGFNFEYNSYEITKFEFVLAPMNGRAKFAKANSGQLTQEMKEMMKDIAPGDRLFFVNTFARIGENKERRVPDLVLTVR